MGNNNYPSLKQGIFLVFLVWISFGLFFFLTLTLPQFFGVILSRQYNLIITMLSTLIWIPLIIYVNVKSGFLWNFKIEIPRFWFIFLLIVIGILAKIVTSPFNNFKELFLIFQGNIKLLVFKVPGLNWNLGFQFLDTVLLVPILEEFFWRNQILKLLLRKFTPTFAIILSSFLFSLSHLQINSIFAFFLFGLLLGIIYYKTKSLEASIILHALGNLPSFILTYKLIKVNGPQMLLYISVIVACTILIVLIIKYLIKGPYFTKVPDLLSN